MTWRFGPLTLNSWATNAIRDAGGAWAPDLARHWLEYTRSIGGEITAAEYMNEPTVAGMSGAPEAYSGEAYGRDFNIFREWAEANAPDMLIHGPGSVGETTEGALLDNGTSGTISTPDLLAGMGEGPRCCCGRTWMACPCGRTQASPIRAPRLSPTSPGKPLRLRIPVAMTCT